MRWAEETGLLNTKYKNVWESWTMHSNPCGKQQWISSIRQKIVSLCFLLLLSISKSVICRCEICPAVQEMCHFFYVGKFIKPPPRLIQVLLSPQNVLQQFDVWKPKEHISLWYLNKEVQNLGQRITNRAQQ